MSRFLYPVLLIAAAAASRLLPHPANVTPVAAIALFGAATLDRRLAFVVPLAAMLISDAVLGFHSAMFWVYLAFAGTVVLGFWLRRHSGVIATASATLVASVMFFLVTNFGMWATPNSLYPSTWEGLVACYVAAIPFFRNSLTGDLFFVAVLFGSYQMLRYAVPALREETSGR